ncbi:ryhB-regulated fur leader peptide [Escherichia coli]
MIRIISRATRANSVTSSNEVNRLVTGQIPHD